MLYKYVFIIITKIADDVKINLTLILNWQYLEIICNIPISISRFLNYIKLISLLVVYHPIGRDGMECV